MNTKRGKRNHGNMPTATRSLRLPIELWARLALESGRTGESINGLAWRILDGTVAPSCNSGVSAESKEGSDVYTYSDTAGEKHL